LLPQFPPPSPPPLKPTLYLFAALLALASGARAQICSSATAPSNTATALSPSGALLSWDSIPGSAGCRVQVQLPSGASLTRKISGFEVNSLFVPASFLTTGTYNWRVQCACSSTSPFDPTPFSAFNSFTVAPASVADIDGNVYPVVSIGTQIWMAENLRTTRFRSGASIPEGLSAGEWTAAFTPASALYNNDAANEALYGRLYNWFAVSDSSGLCPDGWRIPTELDWTVLSNELGGSLVAGGPLKEDSPLWFPPNFGADNSTGFTGRPGGFRTFEGLYFNFRGSGYFWAIDEVSPGAGNALFRRLDFSGTGLTQGNLSKQSGFSVRCILGE
jgi:uncharacterized protein (TIGR02145 family)